MNLQQVFILILIALTVLMTWYLIGSQVKKESRIPLKERLEPLNEKIPGGKIALNEREWKKHLSESHFNALRKGITEKAFSGNLWDEKRPGMYYCRACHLPLFTSKDKLHTNSGWPEFEKPFNENYVALRDDYKLFIKRKEVVCNRCESHLGQVCDEGYCINSSCLKFEEEEAKD
ncbi:peptide-methionine (R)-S-oxide reductase [Criblamydia sequanensis]|uniref:peptide-methionine (R)-S-oxide reductase n=1 Tax=Candidatus Criblamydia sequanensis CRIB-18 TaxID=1437425 RepID=A0A090DYJ5_9BACT|nr:peptide-methionine (R)-S-oxide reductase [Criblamydia sequanensis]CDR33779.1 Peptide methionine sulfoxide reductase MsrB [Criblamydia sequanensis CRIB-18]